MAHPLLNTTVVSIAIVPDPAAGSYLDPAAHDAALAAALIAREPWAATRAWTYLSPMVLAFLRRYFGPSADHEDLCQEVFARFFARIAELRVPQALRSFVIGISLGVAQNERRRAVIRRAITLTATGDLPDHPGQTPDVEAHEAMGRLCEILLQGRAEERTLFVSRFVEECPLLQIARDTGRPVGSVKRRVAQARRRFISRMQRDPALAGYVERSSALRRPVRERRALVGN